MRAWGPVAAIVFAVIMAVVAGSRLDAAAAAMVVGMVVGVFVTTVAFLILFAVMTAHNRRVRTQQEREEYHAVAIVHPHVEVGNGAALARHSKADEVVVT